MKRYTYILAIAAATCALSGCMQVSPDKQAAHNEKSMFVGDTAEDFAMEPYDTALLQSSDINELQLVLTGFADGAPDFSLSSSSGAQISLDEELADQHVLLYFYPADFAPNSTRELRKLSELQIELISSNIKIYGISGKLLEGYASLPEQHRKFHDDFALKIPLLADSGLKVSKAYGCSPVNGLYPQRTMVLIGMDGQVLKYSRLMLNADQIREALIATVASAPNKPADTPEAEDTDVDEAAADSLDAAE